jgi:hypothetical protein
VFRTFTVAYIGELATEALGRKTVTFFKTEAALLV